MSKTPEREMVKLKHMQQLELLEAEHRYNMELATMKILEADPEMKLFLGVLAGAGIASLAVFVQGIGKETPEDKDIVYWYTRVQAAGTLPGLILEIRDFFKGSSGLTLVDIIANTIALAGSSVAALCGLCLLFKYMNGGSDDGMFKQLLAGAM